MKKKGFLIVLLLIAFGIFFAGCNEEVVPTLSLSETTFTTEVGQTATIVPVVTGLEVFELEYSTSNAAVATVANGTITAVSAGNATITVALKDNPDITATASVTVKAKPAITVSFTGAALSTTVGKKVTLTPLITGTTETALTYTSSNTSVATVTTTGEVTAVAEGTATITVALTSNAQIKAVVNITVTKVVVVEDFAPTSIVIMGQDEMRVGQTENFGTTVLPNTSNKTLIWTTSDATVATVDDQGNVTALKPGLVVIGARSALKPTLAKEYPLEVLEVGTEEEIVQRAINYLKGQMPEYVNATFDLPTYPNEKVVVTWLDSNGIPITGGQFVYDVTTDTRTSLTLKVEYNLESYETPIELKLVSDLNNNAFITNDLIKNYLDVYFDQYTKTTPNKVMGDLYLPTSLKGSTINWTSDKGTVISAAGVYTRPDNDTTVVLAATVNSSGISAQFTYSVVANGYSQEEKIAYLFSEGVFQPIHNATISGAISLPTLESRFGLKFTWTSDNLEVLDNQGRYVNIDKPTEPTVVNYSVVVKYEVAGFEFESTQTVKVTVNPLDEVGRAVFAFQQVQHPEILSHVAFGTGDIPSQLVNLPTAVEGHPNVNITWYGKEGEFDSQMRLTVQYLLYHPTTIYAKFSNGTTEQILQFPINIGVIADAGDFGFTARTAAYKGPTHAVTDGFPATDGGTGTVYTLGFGPYYFKANFQWAADQEARDFYFFMAAGNYLSWGSSAITVENGKDYITPAKSAARMAPSWASCARVWQNNTGKTVYVKLVHMHNATAANSLGAVAAPTVPGAYHFFVMDVQGNVTVPKTQIYGSTITEVEIPNGGFLVNPASLDRGSFLRFAEVAGAKIDVASFTTLNVQNAIAAINSLKDVAEITLEDKPAVQAVRTTYNKVVSQEMAYVTNRFTLVAAEVKYGIFELPATDAIALTDKAKINSLNTQYGTLTATLKTKVTNYATLTAAITKIDELEAAATTALIDALPNPVALTDKTQVVAARTSYTALTTAGKALVAAATLTKLTDAEAAISTLEVNNVIALITALPATITLAEETQVTAAKTAYNALTTAQKALVTNYATLTAAETTIANLKAAKTVTDLIAALPATIVLETATQITAARNAYTALTEVQKALVTNLATLEAAEAAVSVLKVNNVIALITALPATVTLTEEAQVVAARTAYNALSATEKTSVTNLATLEAAEAAISLIKVNNVIALITALPATVTLAEEAQVTAARTAYNALSATEKTSVTNLAALEAAEAAIANLKAAKTVVDLIAALPATITLAEETQVVAARTAYAALTEAQKALVTNLSVLEAAEATITSLKSAS